MHNQRVFFSVNIADDFMYIVYSNAAAFNVPLNITALAIKLVTITNKCTKINWLYLLTKD